MEERERKSRDHYEIGKGKPPKEHCFQKGQSGNPKGRPKGSENLHTLLKKELSQIFTVTEAGQLVKLSKRHLFIKKLVNDAIAGKAHAVEKLYGYLKEDADLLQAAEEAKAISANDKSIIERYFEAMKERTRNG